MANPAAGSTPTYGLRWPGGPDPAEGPTGFQHLAQDTEAALTPVDARSKNPQLIWAKLALTAGSIPGGSVSTDVGITISSQGGTSWTTNGALAVQVNAAGAGLYGIIGSSRMSATGTPATGTFMQVQWRAPGVVLSNITNLFGTVTLDVFVLGSFRIAAGANLTVTMLNTSAQAQTLSSGNLTIWRLGD